MKTAAAAPALPVVDRHTPLQSAALHLAPGVLITLVFMLIARLSAPAGWPASLALLITWPAAGLPLLLGLLFYYGFRRNGSLSLEGVVVYRQPLPPRTYAWLVPALLVWAAVTSTLFFALAEPVRQVLFPWWPDWLNLSTFAQDPGAYPPPIGWAVLALSAVLNLAVPIVEELYFRGFLLPRLPARPAWAPLVNTALFSLYHFWLPWDFVGRIVTLLPVAYAVQWKRNVLISILVHGLLNTLGTLGLAALLLGGS